MAEGSGLELHFEVPSLFDLVGIPHDTPILGMQLHQWMPVLMAVIAAWTLIWASRRATRRLTRVPSLYQAFIENIVVGLRDFLHGILGPAAERYVPFLGALFLYILINNYWALIPGMHAATSKYNTTLALAIIVFGVTHYEGIRAYGLKGYLKHFVGEPAWLGPLNVVIHLLGEMSRPLSLSLRLFGNIMGEDTLVAVVVFLGVFVFSVAGLPVPIHLPACLLGMLAGMIQALVFTMLSAVYIGGAAGAFSEGHGHGEEEGHGHGHEGDHGHGKETHAHGAQAHGAHH